MSNLGKRLSEGVIPQLTAQIKQNKAVFAVYVTLRAVVLAALILSIVRLDWEGAFICVLVLALFTVPTIIQRSLKVEFPTLLQIIILLFIFAAEILGELSAYYIQFKHWDTILHTTWGFLCAAVGFSLVELLNSDEKIKFELSPFFLALVAFCFSMTIGIFWEFFEFAADRLLGLDMQKDTIITALRSVTLDETASNIPILVENITSVSINGQELGLGGYLDIGLYDTMEDLFVNFIGALVFSIIGYIDAKKLFRSSLTASLVPKKAKRDLQEENS
ncbi:MAG: hypothetical protein IKZ30_03485 [Oscillospiraceae bacterium]|nr:hypothetical protein [Oscillospiraceae bacterium]